MERRKFLKFLGIGTAAAVVAPTVLAEAIEKPIPVIRTGYSHVVGPGLKEQMEIHNTMYYTPHDNYTIYTGEKGAKLFHEAVKKEAHSYSKLTPESLEQAVNDIFHNKGKSKFHR